MSENKKYTIELLADYVDGLLSQSQRERIDAILEEDELAQGMVDGIRQWYATNGDDREGLMDWLEAASTPLEATIDKPKPIIRKLVTILAAAAACALIMVFILREEPSNLASLTAEYSSEVYNPSFIQRSGEGTLNKAHVAYQKGDYLKSASLYQGVLDSLPTDNTALMMLGLSHFYSGKYDQANSAFSRLIDAPNRFLEHALWHDALALIHMERLREAKSHLQRLSVSDGFKNEQAKELLESSSLEEIQ